MANQGIRSRLIKNLALALFISMGLVIPSALAAGLVVGAGSSISLGTGEVDLGCNDVSIAGTLSLNTGLLDSVRHLSIVHGGVLNGDQGTINMSGFWINNGTFNAGSSTVNVRRGCGVTPSWAVPTLLPVGLALACVLLVGAAWRGLARAKV